MKAIKIISKSEKGDKAIQSTVLEDKKASLLQKAMLKTMGGTLPHITNDNPMTLEIYVPKKVMFLINKEDFINQAKYRMKLNNCVIGLDYIVEVVE